MRVEFKDRNEELKVIKAKEKEKELEKLKEIEAFAKKKGRSYGNEKAKRRIQIQRKTRCQIKNH